MQEITFNLEGFFSGSSPSAIDRHILSVLSHMTRKLKALAPRGETANLRRDEACVFTFELPFFRVESSSLENARVLRILLDGLTTIQRYDLRTHAVPALYRTRVRYERTLWWDDATAALRRGYADCKTLATWLTAQYLNAGIPARSDFRWISNERGNRDFHILVLGPNGYEDPSKVLGMTGDETASFVPNPITGGNTTVENLLSQAG